jgi:hypothetical protein
VWREMRADRRYACDSRAGLDPQRPALDVEVRTRCGRKTLLSLSRGALLLSQAPAKNSLTIGRDRLRIGWYGKSWVGCWLRAPARARLGCWLHRAIYIDGAHIHVQQPLTLDNQPVAAQIGRKALRMQADRSAVTSHDVRERAHCVQGFLLEAPRGLLAAGVLWAVGDRGVGLGNAPLVLPAHLSPNPAGRKSVSTGAGPGRTDQVGLDRAPHPGGGFSLTPKGRRAYGAVGAPRGRPKGRLEREASRDGPEEISLGLHLVWAGT